MDFDFHSMPEQLLEGRPVAVFQFIFLVIVTVLGFKLVRKVFKSLIFKAVVVVLSVLLVYGGVTSPKARAQMGEFASQIWSGATEKYDDFKD